VYLTTSLTLEGGEELSGSNLPPGVSENMIPGNRPEDAAYEKFWDELYTKFVKEYPGNQEELDKLMDGDFFMHFVDMAVEMANAQAYNETKNDLELAKMYEELEERHQDE